MEETSLVMTEAGKKDLITTAKWCKFYAIILFIGVALYVLIGLLMLVFGNYAGQLQPELSAAMIAPMGLFYILLAGIWVMPALYLLQFAKRTEKAVIENDTESLESALNRMKSFWKFMGIFTIVMLSIVILVVPIAVIGAFTL